ncbi:MAG: hypothetical protein ACLRFG_03565 [Clostridia bacterium]
MRLCYLGKSRRRMTISTIVIAISIVAIFAAAFLLAPARTNPSLDVNSQYEMRRNIRRGGGVLA